MFKVIESILVASLTKKDVFQSRERGLFVYDVGTNTFAPVPTGFEIPKIQRKTRYAARPNVLMTLSEYMDDYAEPETKKAGYALIENELHRIPKEKVREITAQNIQEIRRSNRRDFRF